MGRSRIVFDCHTWKILSFTLDSCHHTPRGCPYWEPSKYNCNGNTERIYYPFWSASMDGTITSAAKKKGPLKLGPPAAPAASCTRECHSSSYFCMAAYIWKILAALPKSHIFQVEKYLKLSVKLVWIVLKISKAIPPSPIALPVAKASWPRLLPKALEMETDRRKFMTRNFESFKIPSKNQWSCLKARKISLRKGIHF